MAGGAKAPGCGEYNRKKALARQIYTIRRGRLLPNYHILGWKECLASFASKVRMTPESRRTPRRLGAHAVPRNSESLRTATLRRVSRRSQLGSHEIQNRRQRENDSVHLEFPQRGVRENPNDGDDGKRGDNLHARKIERLTVGTNVALHQKPAGG